MAAGILLIRTFYDQLLCLYATDITVSLRNSLLLTVAVILLCLYVSLLMFQMFLDVSVSLCITAFCLNPVPLSLCVSHQFLSVSRLHASLHPASTPAGLGMPRAKGQSRKKVLRSCANEMVTEPATRAVPQFPCLLTRRGA